MTTPNPDPTPEGSFLESVRLALGILFGLLIIPLRLLLFFATRSKQKRRLAEYMKASSRQ